MLTANKMTPDELNRLGLWFGLVSGLLLIPEILNLIPIDKIEFTIKKWLDSVESWTSFPLRLHPQSWKLIFSEEGRQKYIEPITAILGLLSSATWIITIAIGFYASSKFLVLLGLMLPIFVSAERILQSFANRLTVTKFTVFFFYSLLLTLIVAPPISLVRVTILIFRVIIPSVKGLFARYKVLRALIKIMAILLFIASIVLQWLATY